MVFKWDISMKIDFIIVIIFRKIINEIIYVGKLILKKICMDFLNLNMEFCRDYIEIKWTDTSPNQFEIG